MSNTATKKLIAITGNIGSGKSTVLGMLEDMGICTLSADKFTDKAYTVVFEKLIEAFGSEICEKGEISRKKLGGIAFSSKENLAKLNSIMHPVIFDLMFQNCKNGLNFVEVPLLFESGMEDYFESVWIILASENNKIKRASERDNVTNEEISKRLSFQTNHDLNSNKKHIIIENNGSVEELKQKVKKELLAVNK